MGHRRLRLAQAENFAPFLTGAEQKQLQTKQPHTLTLEVLNQAEGVADQIFTDEFSPTQSNNLHSAPTLNAEAINLGRLTLEPATAQASCDGLPVTIGKTEFRLLHFFMTHPDQVFSRRQLLDQVWGDQPLAEIRTVDVIAYRLRQALGVCTTYLQTIRDEGYRFTVPPALS